MRIALHGLVAAGLILVLGGCGPSRFGSDLKERPRPEPIRRAAGFTMHLPADRPFSIALPQSSHQPGLSGTAKSDAAATRQGDAEAWAEVTDGGQASAMFQLGHALANETGEQADFDFVVKLSYAYNAAATPQTAFSDATTGLKLYARNSLGQLVRDVTLFTHQTGNGPAQSAASESSRFTLTLAPGEAVNVFLAGQAVVDIREQRSATCRVSVTSLTMDVTVRSAQGVPGGAPGPAPATGPVFTPGPRFTPGPVPGSAPGAAPGAAPEPAPGAGPGPTPGVLPGSAPGAVPMPPPGPASGSAAGSAPGPAPTSAPAPGTTPGPSGACDTQP